MFLFKINKLKLKYKLIISMHKLKCNSIEKPNVGQYFSIKVIRQVSIYADRGQHKLEFTTDPMKRDGEIKCRKESQIIPMTLYFDEEDKIFLEKQMEIRGYLMNDMDQVSKELGKVKLNLGDYVKQKENDKFLLSVELFDEQEKSTKINFHLLFTKQQEDSQSVQTSETNKSSRRVSSKQKQTEKIKEKIKIQAMKIPESETSSRNQPTSKRSSLLKESQRTVSLSKDKKKQNTTNYKKNDSKSNQMQELGNDQFNFKDQTIKNKAEQQMTNNNILQYKRSRPPLPPFAHSQTDKNGKNRQKESNQLKLFIAQKALKDRQKDLSQANQQLLNQKKVIDSLLQQKNRQIQSKQAKKFKIQIEGYKSQLLQANIKISQLQTINRHLSEQDQQNCKLMEKQANQINRYKQLLQKQKGKIANIMIRCLQTADYDLIAAVEQLVTDEQYNQ